MTPKDKALELLDKYDDTLEYTMPRHAKICALIAVDEVIPNLPDVPEIIAYWRQVKLYIMKL